jgi:hypothetical protein
MMRPSTPHELKIGLGAAERQRVAEEAREGAALPRISPDAFPENVISASTAAAILECPES